MKKWTLLVAALIMAGSLSACGAGDLGSSSVPPTESTVSDTSTAEPQSEPEYTHDLDGLANKLAFHGYIDASKKQQMRADFIGAESEKGFKYAMSSGTLELYEYDPSNLSDKAKECIEEVKSTGKVTVLKDYGPVDAVLSNNEKYLMIYQDSQNDEQAIARKAEITEIVKTFE